MHDLFLLCFNHPPTAWLVLILFYSHSNCMTCSYSVVLTLQLHDFFLFCCTHPTTAWLVLIMLYSPSNCKTCSYSVVLILLQPNIDDKSTTALGPFLLYWYNVWGQGHYFWLNESVKWQSFHYHEYIFVGLWLPCSSNTMFENHWNGVFSITQELNFLSKRIISWKHGNQRNFSQRDWCTSDYWIDQNNINLHLNNQGLCGSLQTL